MRLQQNTRDQIVWKASGNDEKVPQDCAFPRTQQDEFESKISMKLLF